ncbi:MAG: FkbM family methyltransferase [Taibaiella sp.]|nr:FkbM family methyltransferase [Taibaiella sp.]
MFRIIKRRFLKYLTKLYDPVTNIQIGNKTIKISLSHHLNEILKLYPDYNFNLPRIIKYASNYYKEIRVIDIGANIGDTVAFIKNLTDVPILCIDGEKKYIKLLKENIAEYNNVYICETLVGAENTESNVKLKVEKGTAHLEEATEKTTIRTLENILDEYPDFKNSKILKSDTDGFDTIILRSCSAFLKKAEPILFFEFDPHFIKMNNDDPFSFIEYLKDCGYYYFIFYVNNGDFLISCSIEEPEIIDQVIHYFSGRYIETFTDICAFTKTDEKLYNYSVAQEIAHFKKARNY